MNKNTENKELTELVRLAMTSNCSKQEFKEFIRSRRKEGARDSKN